MIESVTLQKCGNDEPPLFEVGYADPERKGQKNYVWTTRYGSETEMREFLKSRGVSAPEIDGLFERGKL